MFYLSRSEQVALFALLALLLTGAGVFIHERADGGVEMPTLDVGSHLANRLVGLPPQLGRRPLRLLDALRPFGVEAARVPQDRAPGAVQEAPEAFDPAFAPVGLHLRGGEEHHVGP